MSDTDGTPAYSTPTTEHVLTGGTFKDPVPAAPAPAPAAAPAPAPATQTTVTPTWPENWRHQMTEDEKELRQLARYASPSDLWRKNRELEKKLSSGNLKPGLVNDPSEEDIADYRKAWGIPDSADKYDLSGVKDESLKPVIAEFAKVGHGVHMTPEQMKAVAALVPDIQRRAVEAQAEADKKREVETIDALHAEWGADYRRNINVIHGLLDSTMAPDMKASFLGGRLADGTPIEASQGALKMLLELALVKNPAGVVVPSVNGDPGKGVKDQINEIRALRLTNRTKYDKDNDMQARERRLIDAALQLGIMDAQGNWKEAV
jgi:hypothetical protein